MEIRSASRFDSPIGAAVLFFFAPVLVLAQKASSPIGKYADVNGMKMYYEVHGKGQPLLLLHGRITASEMFGDAIKTLAKKRQVVVVHLQGHGHTADIARFRRMKQDTCFADVS